MEGYIGEVRLFAGTFVPKNWALCDGKILLIQDYKELFSVIGTNYGGDGQTSFQLPNITPKLNTNEVNPIQYIICIMGIFPSFILSKTLLKADYQFQNNYKSSLPNVPDLQSIGQSFFKKVEFNGNNITVLKFEAGTAISLENCSQVIPQNKYSIVVLFYVENNEGYKRIIDFKNRKSDTGLYTHGTNIKFYDIQEGTGNHVLSNKFIQVAITRDENKNVNCYIDNNREITFFDHDDLAVIDLDNVLSFFRDDNNEHSAGAVARIRLYDNALSSAEIESLNRIPHSLYEVNFAPFYPLSGNANDASINRYHGIVYGATSVADYLGNPFRAFQFDGVDDYLEFPEITGIRSISMWVKIPDRQNSCFFIDANDKQMAVKWNGAFYFSSGWKTIVVNMKKIDIDSVSVAIPEGEWVHLYLEALSNFTDKLILMSSISKENYLAGSISEIRIYNCQLSETEIQGLYKTKGLAAYYPLKGNTLDASGNHLHGIVNAATPTCDYFGKPNGAYLFDGVRNYFQVPKINNARSISMWIKIPDSQIGWHYLLDAREGLSDGWINIGNCGSDWQKIFVNGVKQEIWDYESIPVGEWTHLYFEASTNFSDDITFMARFTKNECLAGSITEIRIYNRALCDAEIQELYQPKGLTAFYPFIGNALVHGAKLTNDHSGNPFNAYQFDGLDNYIDIGKGILSGTDDFTLCLRFKTTSKNKTQFIISQRASEAFGGSNGEYVLQLIDGKLKFWTFKDGYKWSVSSEKCYNDGNWHFAAVVQTGNGGKLYINNELAGSDDSGKVDLDVNICSYIGGDIRDKTNYFEGVISDVRIYKRSLSDDEIQEIYQSNELTAYYPFKGNVLDESGNNRHGFLNGAASVEDFSENPDSAYQFDGHDDYLKLPFMHTIRSISMWVNIPNGQFGQRYLLDTKEKDKNKNWIAANDCGSNWNMLINGSKQAACDYVFIPKGKWVHLYLEAKENFNDNINFMSNTNFSECLAGAIAEIRIFNRSLTNTEINELYRKQNKKLIALQDEDFNSEGLTAYYPFKGDAVDLSGNNHHGVIFGAIPAVDCFGNQDRAYQFDGVDDYIDIGYNILSGDGDFSISIQFKTTASSKQVIIQQRSSDACGGCNGEYMLQMQDGKLQFWTYKDGYKWESISEKTYHDGQWHFITAVQTGSGGKIYIDNDEIVTNSKGRVDLDSNICSYIGADVRNKSDYFKGTIANVRIYKRALSDNEVQKFHLLKNVVPAYNIAEVQASNLTKELAAFYPFKGNALDVSGNNHHGIVYGPTLAADFLNNPDSAYQFNGHEYIDIGNMILGGVGDFSISVKFKTTASSKQVIIQQRASYECGGCNGEYILLMQDGKLKFWTFRDGFYKWDFISEKNYNDGKWHCITAVQTGDGGKIYIDNENPISSSEGKVDLDPNVCSYIGADIRDNTDYFIGTITNIRIYKRALLEFEIQEIHVLNNGQAAHYPLSGNANDASDNKLHGMIQGATPVVDFLGNPDHAYQFDGVNDYLKLPEINNIRSVSMWINIPSGQTSRFFIDAANNKNMQIKWDGAVYYSTGWETLYVNRKKYGNESHYADIPEGEWVHLYLEALSNFTDELIFMSSISKENFLAGTISEIRIYNRPLLIDEIQDLYQTKRLAACYPLKGNALDASENHLNGIIYGAAPVPDFSGNPNGAYLFDGINDYLKVPKINNARSISMWVKIPDGQINWHYLLDAREGLSEGWIGTGGSSSGWQKMFVNGVKQETCDYNIIPKGEWVHLYIEASTNFSDDITFMSRFTENECLKGIITQIEIYNNTLSDSEIQELYQSKTLAAFYPLKENARDASGNNRHGTVYGAISVIDPSGDNDKVYQFDGTDDYIDIGNRILGGSGDFTIFFRFKTTSLSTQVIIQQRASETFGGINGGYMAQLVDGKLKFSTYKDGDKWAVISEETYNDGNWHYLAAVQTGNGGIVYIDNKEIGKSSGRVELNADIYSYIGADKRENTGFFNGSIADVRLHNRALTPSEIFVDSQIQKPVISFDGVDDYITLYSGSSLYFRDHDFTAEAWIKVNAFSEDTSIFGTDETGVNMGLHLIIRNKKPYMGFYANDLSGNTVLEEKKWYHLAWSYQKSTGTQSIFVNGILDNHETGHDAFQGTDTVNIGRCFNGRYFNGEITEVRVWNFARTEEEIKNTMNHRLKGDETGLVGYWRFDDYAGLVAKDLSSGANDGIIHGASWYLSKDLPIKMLGNPVLDFDGAGDYICLCPASELGFTNHDFTAEAWIKIKKSGGDLCLFGTDAYGENIGLHLIIRNDRPYMGFYANDIGSNTVISENKWYHIAWRYDINKGEQAIFVNGELDNSSNGHSAFQGTDFINIGRCFNGNYFKGQICEIRIWNIVRTNEEIKTNMSTKLTGEEDGLTAYYPLDSVVNNVAKDFTSNSNNGKIFGANWLFANDISLLEAVFVSKIPDSYKLPDPDSFALETYELLDIDVSQLPEPFKTLGEKITDAINNEASGIPKGSLKIDSSLLGPFDIFGNLIGIDLSFIEISEAQLQVIGNLGGNIQKPEEKGQIGLRLIGRTSLFGLETVTVKLELFINNRGKPTGVLKIIPDHSWGLSEVFPDDVPIVDWLNLESPAIVLASENVYSDKSLSFFIIKGFNAYGDIPILRNTNKMLEFMIDMIGADKLSCQAAMSTIATGFKYIVKAALKTEKTIIDGGDILNVKYIDSEIAIEISGTPPEPSITIANTMLLSMSWANAEALYFTGAVKLETESITASYTLNKTGSGGAQWREPFGIPGIIIRNLAAQIGFSYAPPWIDNIGFAGDVAIGNIDGSSAILIDINDPDQFVIMLKTAKISILDILVFMAPLAFIAYQAVPSGVRDILNKIIDVSLKDVDINIVPAPTKIGNLVFEQVGVTVKGTADFWGWQSQVNINVASDNILADGFMDQINLSDIFKIEGKEGDLNPNMHLQIGTNSIPELYIASKVYLLGITKELQIKADDSGFNFLLEDDYASILTTRLKCSYGNERLQGSGNIEFRLNLDTGPIYVFGIKVCNNISLVDVGMDTSTVLTITSSPSFKMILNGSFTLWGISVSVPAIEINNSPSDFKDILEIIQQEIINNADEIFKSLFSNLLEWANAIANGVIEAGEAVAHVAKLVYGAAAEETINACKTVGQGVKEIAGGLEDAYGFTADVTAEALNGAGYAAQEVGEALEDAYGLGAEGVTSALKGAGYAVDEVGDAIKNVYNLGEDGVENALKYAGYSAGAIADFMDDLFPIPWPF